MYKHFMKTNINAWERTMKFKYICTYISSAFIICMIVCAVGCVPPSDPDPINTSIPTTSEEEIYYTDTYLLTVFEEVFSGKREVLLYGNRLILANCSSYGGEQLCELKKFKVSYIDLDRDGCIEAVIKSDCFDGVIFLYYDQSEKSVNVCPAEGRNYLFFTNGEYGYNQTDYVRYRITDLSGDRPQAEIIDYYTIGTEPNKELAQWSDIEILRPADASEVLAQFSEKIYAYHDSEKKQQMGYSERINGVLYSISSFSYDDYNYLLGTDIKFFHGNSIGGGYLDYFEYHEFYDTGDIFRLTICYETGGRVEYMYFYTDSGKHYLRLEWHISNIDNKKIKEIEYDEFGNIVGEIICSDFSSAN